MTIILQNPTCSVCGAMATAFVYDTTIASSVLSAPLKASYCREHAPKVTFISDERIRELLHNLPAPDFLPGLPPRLQQLVDEG